MISTILKPNQAVMRADMMDESCIFHPPHVQLENLGNAAVIETLPMARTMSATTISPQAKNNIDPNIDPTPTFQFGNLKQDLTKGASHQRKIVPSSQLITSLQTSIIRPNLNLHVDSNLEVLQLKNKLLLDRVVDSTKSKGRRSFSISSGSYSLVSDSISLSSAAYSLVSSSDEEDDDENDNDDDNNNNDNDNDNDDEKTNHEDELCDCKVNSLPRSPLLLSPWLQSPFPDPLSTANIATATTTTTTTTITTTDDSITRTKPNLPLITIIPASLITTEASTSILTSASILTPALNFKPTPILSSSSLNSPTTAQPGLSVSRRELSGPSRQLSTPRPFKSDVTCLDVPIPHVNCDACSSCDDVCGHADCKACEKKTLAINKAKQCTSSTSWLGGKIQPKFTWCQVRRRNHKDACWYVVRNKVYDATKYLASGVHPGHTKTLLKKAGQDATNDFRFHSKQARNLLTKMHIGSLVTCDSQHKEAKAKKSWALSQW